MNVPRETCFCLSAYTELLTRWNHSINLVGCASIAEVETRHISDSLQLLELKPAPGPLWADLGSGGGLPGIPIACSLRESGTRVVMIESDLRKATFLRRVGARLDLNVEVVTRRIEATTPLRASTVSARALAPLPKLLSYVARHMDAGGTALLPKGARWTAEVEAARVMWNFDLQAHPSQTAEGSVILEIGNIRAK